MKKGYVIYKIFDKTYFFGANPKPIFSSDNWIIFDTEEQAINRLKEEYELFETYFEGQYLIIIPIIYFEY